MTTQREKATRTTGSKELETAKTYEVISLLVCPTPCYISPCQDGTVPETCGVALRTSAKGNICTSGGVSGERAAERALSLCWQETPTTQSTVFLLPYFILNVKAFHTTVASENDSLTSVASVETIFFHAP